MKIRFVIVLFCTALGMLNEVVLASNADDPSPVPNSPTTQPKKKKPKNGGKTPPNKADPVGVVDGSVLETVTDISIPCPGLDLVFRRAYSSADAEEGRNGALGLGWSHSYAFSIEDLSNGFVRVQHAADPEIGEGYATPLDFPVPAFGCRSVPDGGTYRLAREEDGSWSFQTSKGLVYRFTPERRLSSVAHVTGPTVLFVYDEIGRLVRAEHSNGKFLSFSYSNDGLLDMVATPDPDYFVRYNYGSFLATNVAVETTHVLKRVEASFHGCVNVAEYEYSPMPIPGKTRAAAPIGLSPTSGSGVTFSRTVSSAVQPTVHLLSEKKDEDGFHAYYDYIRPDDGLSARCGGMFSEGGWFETSFVYADGKTTAFLPTSAGIVATAFEYGDDGREKLRKTGTEVVERFYDALGNLVARRLSDASTGATSSVVVAYGDLNNVTSVVRSLNGRSRGGYSFAWDDGWLMPRRIVTPTGRICEWVTNGNEFVFCPAGAANAFGKIRALCTDDWRPLEVLSGDGVRTVLSYDASNYVSRVATDGMPAVEYVRDALGRVASKVLPGPSGARVTSYERNRRGYATHVAYPDGTSESFTRNGDGRHVVKHVDRAGRIDVYNWILGYPFHAGRILNGVTNHLWSITYDQQMNLVSVIDPMRRASETYVLDGNARIVAVTNLEGQVMTRRYLLGMLVDMETRFDGSSVTYFHDGGSDLERIDYPDATIAFTHDADGLLTSASNSAGVVSNVYDAVTGRLVSSRGVDGLKIAYTYHLGGGVASITSPVCVFSNSLDAAGRKSALFTPAGNIGFGYCPWNGGLAVVTNVNGTITSYAYDVMDRVTNITWSAADGSRIGGFAYCYNALGRIVSRNHDLGTNVFNRTYTYDDFDRLASDGNISYTYDAAGNRMTKIGDVEGDVSYALGVGDRLASWTGGSYTYTDAGCVTHIERAGKPTLELTWNSQYQLVSVATNGVFAERYSYDALGRRVATMTQEGTVRHVYDNNWQCIADVDASGNVLRSYIWGDGIDNLLAVKIGDEVYTALTDIQGTVWGFTDGNGNVIALWRYDAWGNILSARVLVPAIATMRYRFQGREWSAVTGLTNFRARWYDADSGRWLSKDPIGISGGLNLYAFGGGDPLNYRDPNGLASKANQDGDKGDTPPSDDDGDSWWEKFKGYCRGLFSASINTPLPPTTTTLINAAEGVPAGAAVINMGRLTQEASHILMSDGALDGGDTGHLLNDIERKHRQNAAAVDNVTK